MNSKHYWRVKTIIYFIVFTFQRHNALGTYISSTTGIINSEKAKNAESEFIVSSEELNSNSKIHITTEEKKKHRILYEHVDKKKLEQNCLQAKDCPSSELYWIVCGDDGINYQNLGVLACAQRCKNGIKFKKFGPCENSVPLLEPIISSTSSTTSINKPRKRTLKELVDQTINVDESKILEYLKNRIKSRHNHRGLPSDLEEWCHASPEECPYGYDPSVDSGVYTIPAAPYAQHQKKVFG